MSRRPSNGCRDDLKDEPTRGKRYPSSKKERGLQASLHSCKEQKRRLQIRTSCRRLCDLLPFLNGQLDTATTLELTARYISYLKETLPPGILSKVNEAVEADVSGSWKNKEKPQQKRRTVRLKKNSLQRAKPAAKKSTEADGLTTAHALPILLDKSAVPRGQMLPVCRDQFLSASFEPAENDWMNPTPCAFTSAMMSHTFLPQIGLQPSSSPMFWDATPDLVDPVALPSVNFGQAYSPPEQTTITNFIVPLVEQGQFSSSLAGPTDSVSAGDFTNQPLIPFSVFQSATLSSDNLIPEAGYLPVSDTLCDSGLLQENNLCSSSSLTDSPYGVDNPSWLDLLLDTNGNLCFPDAHLVNIVLSPYTGSN
uniref:uncharacterized protein LOC117259608 isoform X2 n=1 Tax=Epinephelus lanceolatus TaxID=310571 RepID=UPI00144604D0|nr:uncharacterized protein LOC117259608 isoform X2 [Epinephelus lanceolatus]